MNASSLLSDLPWPWLTRMGEAQILLPLALAAAGWLAWHEHQRAVAWRWMATLSVAVALTTASKLAFMGWGIGLAAWDFTGFSGHAMFAAATLPLLGWTVLSGRRGGLLPGMLLATLVAWSRVEVHAHSLSEAVLGWMLGMAATLLALRGAQLLPRHMPLWVPGGVLALLMLTPLAAPRSMTHDWVTRLSLHLSGRSHPYTREDLHRRLDGNARLRWPQAMGGVLLAGR